MGERLKGGMTATRRGGMIFVVTAPTGRDYGPARRVNGRTVRHLGVLRHRANTVIAAPDQAGDLTVGRVIAMFSLIRGSENAWAAAPFGARVTHLFG